MKIAVVGAGIAGLTAAYKLAPHHQVTILEANHYLGGHTNTVDVIIDGVTYPIDTGFIVYNPWTYPNFIALLEELGVATQPTEMGFSVHCEQTGVEYNGTSLNGLFTQRRNLVSPRFHRLLRDILRFNRDAVKQVMGEDSPARDWTVAHFLDHYQYGNEFRDLYLLPMGSAIWSCPIGTFGQFPIRFIVEFYRNHGLLNVIDRPVWRVIKGGSRTYVQALQRRFSGTIRLSTPVRKVTRHPDRVDVTVAHKASPVNVNSMQETMSFDHVVFACHSDQALRMLGDDATANERDLLGCFPYEKNIAVLHLDRSLLPTKRRAWASWNYRIPKDNLGKATVTYCMNLLQSIESPHVFNVTLNSDHQIDPDKILGRFEYEHPIFTTRRAEAQARHHEVIGPNRSSFCGAYWRNGFHEDGVVSALAVCAKLIPREPEQIAQTPGEHPGPDQLTAPELTAV